MKLAGHYLSLPLPSVVVACLILSGCMGAQIAVPPARDALHLERLEPIPEGGSSELTQELIKSNNSAVKVANQRSDIAEKLDHEAILRQQEAETLKAAMERQTEAHTWETLGHWLLEGGLVSALIIVVL